MPRSACGGALPIYEEAHPLRRLMSPSVERDFLHRRQQLLGDAVQPVLVADAGFRGPSFTQVETPGWHWIGRVRGRTYVQAAAGEWMGCRALLARATGRPVNLGLYCMLRPQPVCGASCCSAKRRRGDRG